jgi:hypothetical protein
MDFLLSHHTLLISMTQIVFDNLAPDPTMFDNEVPLGMDTLKKVYTQSISALNDD